MVPSNMALFSTHGAVRFWEAQRGPRTSAIAGDGDGFQLQPQVTRFSWISIGFFTRHFSETESDGCWGIHGLLERDLFTFEK